MSRRVRSSLPAPLLFLFALFTSQGGPGALTLDPALSKHWGTRPAAVRVAVVALLVALATLLLVAAMRTSSSIPLARWVLH